MLMKDLRPLVLWFTTCEGEFEKRISCHTWNPRTWDRAFGENREDLEEDGEEREEEDGEDEEGEDEDNENGVENEKKN